MFQYQIGSEYNSGSQKQIYTVGEQTYEPTVIEDTKIYYGIINIVSMPRLDDVTGFAIGKLPDGLNVHINSNVLAAWGGGLLNIGKPFYSYYKKGISRRKDTPWTAIYISDIEMHSTKSRVHTCPAQILSTTCSRCQYDRIAFCGKCQQNCACACMCIYCGEF